MDGDLHDQVLVLAELGFADDGYWVGAITVEAARVGHANATRVLLQVAEVNAKPALAEFSTRCGAAASMVMGPSSMVSQPVMPTYIVGRDGSSVIPISSPVPGKTLGWVRQCHAQDTRRPRARTDNTAAAAMISARRLLPGVFSSQVAHRNRQLRCRRPRRHRSGRHRPRMTNSSHTVVELRLPGNSRSTLVEQRASSRPRKGESGSTTGEKPTWRPQATLCEVIHRPDRRGRDCRRSSGRIGPWRAPRTPPVGDTRSGPRPPRSTTS